jgi:hypothetical protein
MSSYGKQRYVRRLVLGVLVRASLLTAMFSGPGVSYVSGAGDSHGAANTVVRSQSMVTVQEPAGHECPPGCTPP